MQSKIFSDVIIVGAGAAGLMCAIEAAKRGRQVIVFDHANKAGKKILMSGGGRCNFTNLYTTPDNYISHNPHFCKSALSRYTQWDFIDLVKQHSIPFHEKEAGQLFCDNKSQDILNMLLNTCAELGVSIQLNTTIDKITKNTHFTIHTDNLDYECESLVCATGGLSIPTMGASPFGYKLAEQFGIKVWPTRAGLVPLTLHLADKERFSVLSGTAVNSVVTCPDKSFSGNILFTHRGLSGPTILQLSSYWHPGESISINLLPDIDLITEFKMAKTKMAHYLKSFFCSYLPKKLVDILLSETLADKRIHDISDRDFLSLQTLFQTFKILPNGTEGYRTAEVTLGGVDCDALSSKTMEAKSVSRLYFIGEVVDMTGWLGGYNFQWAWSSAVAAGQVV